MAFFQEAPLLDNQYKADRTLQSLLKRLLSSTVFFHCA